MSRWTGLQEVGLAIAIGWVVLTAVPIVSYNIPEFSINFFGNSSFEQALGKYIGPVSISAISLVLSVVVFIAERFRNR